MSTMQQEWEESFLEMISSWDREVSVKLAKLRSDVEELRQMLERLNQYYILS